MTKFVDYFLQLSTFYVPLQIKLKEIYSSIANKIPKFFNHLSYSRKIVIMYAKYNY